ncbi:MAG: CsbD family protein [Ilumatobacteraceae bacterium]
MAKNFDEAAGRVKQAAADLTDDRDLERDGKRQEAAGKVKEAAGKAKDAFDRAVDKVKDAANNDR